MEWSSYEPTHSVVLTFTESAMANWIFVDLRSRFHDCKTVRTQKYKMTLDELSAKSYGFHQACKEHLVLGEPLLCCALLQVQRRAGLEREEQVRNPPGRAHLALQNLGLVVLSYSRVNSKSRTRKKSKTCNPIC